MGILQKLAKSITNISVAPSSPRSTRNKTILSLNTPKPTKLQKADVIKKLQAKCHGIDADLERIERTQKYRNNEGIFIDKDATSQLFPELDGRHCPSCHYDFGKNLVRGRECPACGAKLHVRNYKIFDTQHDEMLEKARADWLALFQARLLRSDIDREFEYGTLMTVIGRIVELYEQIGDFDGAWQCLSGKDPNVPIDIAWLICIAEDNDNGSVSADNMIAIEYWRAEFLDRRFKNKEWKVGAGWVIEMYIGVLKKALQCHIPSDYGNAANAVTKLSVYADTGYSQEIRRRIPESPENVQKVLIKIVS